MIVDSVWDECVLHKCLVPKKFRLRCSFYSQFIFLVRCVLTLGREFGRAIDHTKCDSQIDFCFAVSDGTHKISFSCSLYSFSFTNHHYLYVVFKILRNNKIVSWKSLFVCSSVFPFMWHSQRHGVLGKLLGRDGSNKASIWFPLLSRNIAICPIKRDELMMVMSQLSASIKLIGAVGLWVMYSVYQPTGLMERLGQVIIPHYYTAISPQTVFDRKFLNSLSLARA